MLSLSVFAVGTATEAPDPEVAPVGQGFGQGFGVETGRDPVLSLDMTLT